MNEKNTKLLSLLLILILIVSTVGCTDADLTNTEGVRQLENVSTLLFKKTVKNNDSDTKILNIEGEDVIGLRLLDSDGNITPTLNFRLDENQNWEYYISLVHLTKKIEKYKLLLFVDYKKATFFVDNNQVNDFSFEISHDKIINIPVKITTLSSGLHDVLFVLVRDVEGYELNEESRINSKLKNLLFLRYTITVRNSNVERSNNINVEYNYLTEPYTEIMINKSDKGSDYWLVDNIKPNSSLPYYIHVKNFDKSLNKKYATIVLFNWEQTSLNKDGEKVLYFEIPPEKEVSIPCELKIPGVSRVYDLTPIVILNPYEYLERKNKQVITSVRTGINAE